MRTEVDADEWITLTCPTGEQWCGCPCPCPHSMVLPSFLLPTEYFRNLTWNRRGEWQGSATRDKWLYVTELLACKWVGLLFEWRQLNWISLVPFCYDTVMFHQYIKKKLDVSIEDIFEINLIPRELNNPNDCTQNKKFKTLLWSFPRRDLTARVVHLNLTHIILSSLFQCIVSFFLT